ncbi:MAG: hypothetical protein ABGZ17_04990 [Planctomycetaceae bacterium]
MHSVATSRISEHYLSWINQQLRLEAAELQSTRRSRMLSARLKTYATALISSLPLALSRTIAI